MSYVANTVFTVPSRPMVQKKSVKVTIDYRVVMVCAIRFLAYVQKRGE